MAVPHKTGIAIRVLRSYQHMAATSFQLLFYNTVIP